jgi:hypothetical protein
MPIARLRSFSPEAALEVLVEDDFGKMRRNHPTLQLIYVFNGECKIFILSQNHPAWLVERSSHVG